MYYVTTRTHCHINIEIDENLYETQILYEV